MTSPSTPHPEPLSDDDTDWNTSENPSFSEVLQAHCTRRKLLAGLGSSATLMGLFPFSTSVALAKKGSSTPSAQAPLQPHQRITALDFSAVPKGKADAVRVPEGYQAQVVFALGDPLNSRTPAYRNDGTDTDFDSRAGDHHDGMEYFGLSADGRRRDPHSSQRGLLVMNHEAVTNHFLHPAGASALPRPSAEADKEIAAHGVSVVEVIRKASGWEYVVDSLYNRRVTPLTPVELSGAARGHSLCKTRYSPTGQRTRGTLNNCGTGCTPWGTFLTGEENWAGYFTRSPNDDAARGATHPDERLSLLRYARPQGATSRYGWETAGRSDRFARWDISVTGTSPDGTDDYRHEANTMGFIVELDPFRNQAMIKKRTSLGRFAHESAAFGLLTHGQPLAVYMGDDSRGEYIYKFVSAAPWDRSDARPSDPMATGDKYLDKGTLYVARFHEDGTGTWEALSMRALGTRARDNKTGYRFADDGDVCIHARLAADAVGATKMDRPEWCAVHPDTGEVYVSLTNNSQRKLEPAGTQQGLHASSPRAYTNAGAAATQSQGNLNGHIIRLRENSHRTTATTFTWDVYLFGARSTADAASINLSALNEDQDFSGPDGVWFSQHTGLCWIQTDDRALSDASNCMMLAGVAGRVGDGESVVVRHTRTDGSAVDVPTLVGRPPSASQLKRFLVGPVQCEITGCTETPDGKTLFVNIQHPGEEITAQRATDPQQYTSHWPANAGYGPGGALGRPRSATVAIIHTNGLPIGSGRPPFEKGTPS